MQFSKFLHQDLRSHVWKKYRDSNLIGYGISEYLKKNSKQIFLEIVQKYAREYGADNLIKEKVSIIKHAKARHITNVEIVRHIYLSVGEDVASLFNKKNIFLKHYVAMVIIALVSFLFGALFF